MYCPKCENYSGYMQSDQGLKDFFCPVCGFKCLAKHYRSHCKSEFRKSISGIVAGLFLLIFFPFNSSLASTDLSLSELLSIKDRVYFDREVDDIRCDEQMNCFNNGKMIMFSYISNENVPIKQTQYNDQVYYEDISKRTTNSEFYYLGKNQYIIHSHVGHQQALIDNQWKKVIRKATTTLENWEILTKETLLDKLLSFFGRSVVADSISPNTEVGDGRVYVLSQPSWSSARNAVSGTADYTSADASGVVCSLGYTILRAFYPTDTSAIPDSATIQSASLFRYKSNNNVISHQDSTTINIVQTTQANTNSLVSTDFDEVTFVDGGSVTMSSIGDASGWKEIPFNSTGLTYISKDSITKIGLITGLEISDSPPAGYNDTREHDWSEGTNDPYIEVIYTLDSTPPVVPGNLVDWSVGSSTFYASALSASSEYTEPFRPFLKFLLGIFIAMMLILVLLKSAVNYYKNKLDSQKVVNVRFDRRVTGRGIVQNIQNIFVTRPTRAVNAQKFLNPALAQSVINDTARQLEYEGANTSRLKYIDVRRIFSWGHLYKLISEHVSPRNFRTKSTIKGHVKTRSRFYLENPDVARRAMGDEYVDKTQDKLL